MGEVSLHKESFLAREFRKQMVLSFAMETFSHVTDSGSPDKKIVFENF